MPKELHEISKFMAGTVTVPSETDISDDTASYSLNIDPVAKDGILKGIPDDLLAIIKNESRSSPSTQDWANGVTLITTDSTSGFTDPGGSSTAYLYVEDDTGEAMILGYTNIAHGNFTGVTWLGPGSGNIDNNDAIYQVADIVAHKMAMINDDGTHRVVYFDDQDDKIKKIDDIHGTVGTTATLSTAAESKTGTPTMEVNNKEVHIGMGKGVDDKALWCGIISKGQFGEAAPSGLQLERSELIGPDITKNFYQACMDNASSINPDYIYGIEWNGQRIYRFNIEENRIDRNSGLMFNQLRAMDVTTSGALWVYDWNNSTYPTVYKINPADFTIMISANLSAIDSDDEDIKYQAVTDIMVTEGSSPRVWISRGSDSSPYFNQDVYDLDELSFQASDPVEERSHLYNFVTPTTDGQYIPINKTPFMGAEGAGSSGFAGAWRGNGGSGYVSDSSGDTTGGEIFSFHAGATNLVRVFTNHTTYNEDYVGKAMHCQGAGSADVGNTVFQHDSSTLTQTVNHISVVKHDLVALEKLDGSNGELVAIAAAAGSGGSGAAFYHFYKNGNALGSCRSNGLNADAALRLSKMWISGGQTSYYDDYKQNFHMTFYNRGHVIGYDGDMATNRYITSFTQEQIRGFGGNKGGTTVADTAPESTAAVVGWDASTAAANASDSIYYAQEYRIFNGAFQQRSQCARHKLHYIGNPSGGVSSVQWIKEIVADDLAILEVTDLGTTSGNYINTYTYFWKASFVYDGYQESPLGEAVSITAGSSEVDKRISVRIYDTLASLFPKRIQKINLWRAYAPVAAATEPTGFYRLISTIDFEKAQYLHGEEYTDWDQNSWVSYTTKAVSYKWYPDYRNFLYDDLGEAGGVSYEALVGISEVVEETSLNYSLSTQLNNQLFVADCYHNSLDDATNYMFKSQPYNFDQFDWSLDLLRLPTKPTALASFNGRVYAFGENNTYRIEPQSFYIEDTFEGVGCMGPDAVIVTEYGMCFADKNNIYLHDGRQPVPIGDSILRGDDKSWQNRDTTWASKVIFDAARNSFVVLFKYSSNYYAWAFNVARRRWDLWETFGTTEPLATLDGKNGEMFISDGHLKHYLGSTSITRDWDWYSKKLTMGQETQIKKFRRFRTTGSPSGSLGTNTYVKVDGVDVAESGNNAEFKVDNQAGKHVQWHFTGQTGTIDAIGTIFRRRPVK